MIFEKIQADLKTALKEKDRLEVSTLRFLVAALKDKEIELQKRGELSDEEVTGVIRKQVKQRQESIEAYQKGKRDDLADKEKKEAEILGNYLPQEISPKELEKAVLAAIEKTGAGGPQDFGKVMGMVMGQLKDRADGSSVSKMVKEKLQ